MREFDDLPPTCRQCSQPSPGYKTLSPFPLSSPIPYNRRLPSPVSSPRVLHSSACSVSSSPPSSSSSLSPSPLSLPRPLSQLQSVHAPPSPFSLLLTVCSSPLRTLRKTGVGAGIGAGPRIGVEPQIGVGLQTGKRPQTSHELVSLSFPPFFVRSVLITVSASTCPHRNHFSETV